jgi:hypothetical protein
MYSSTVLCTIPWTTFFLVFCHFRTFLGANDAPRDLLQYVLWIGSQTNFLTKLRTFKKSPVWSVCMVTVYIQGARFAKTKPPFDQKSTPSMICWAWEMCLSCSTRVRRLTARHTSTRSFYNSYRSLWDLLVPTFRIFEDFRGFWLGTCNIYPGCPAKNIWDSTIF